MTFPKLFLDMDGVLADFEGHFLRTFRKDIRTMENKEKWKLIHGEQNLFEKIPPMPGALEFFNKVEHLSPIILTACPSSKYEDVARQKRNWIRNWISEDVMFLPVNGSETKQLFLQHPGDILIDDWEKNINRWREAGGIGILHTDFDISEKALARALNNA